LTQKDSGVERVVQSDSIDVDSILAGWWQDFDGLCRLSYTWQQPDEQCLRDELKKLSKVPVCQPSRAIFDGFPALEDPLFFKKPEPWTVHNGYVMDNGCAKFDDRIHGENSNHNQHSCLFSMTAVEESALQSCTVGTSGREQGRQDAEKPCGEILFATGNGRSKSQYTGMDLEIESASSHAEAHTWIKHACDRNDPCQKHVLGRLVQQSGSLLRGGRKANLDLSEPQASAQIYMSTDQGKIPSAPEGARDTGVDPCMDGCCNVQSRSDGASVDENFSCHFPRTHGSEFEPQPFAVGAFDDMMYGQGNIHQVRHDIDLPSEMLDANQSFPSSNEKFADCGLWQDCAKEGTRRHQGEESRMLIPQTGSKIKNMAAICELAGRVTWISLGLRLKTKRVLCGVGSRVTWILAHFRTYMTNMTNLKSSSRIAADMFLSMRRLTLSATSKKMSIQLPFEWQIRHDAVAHFGTCMGRSPTSMAFCKCWQGLIWKIRILLPWKSMANPAGMTGPRTRKASMLVTPMMKNWTMSCTKWWMKFKQAGCQSLPTLGFLPRIGFKFVCGQGR